MLLLIFELYTISCDFIEKFVLDIQYTLVSRTQLIEIPVNTYTVSVPFKAFLILKTPVNTNSGLGKQITLTH